MSFKEDSFHNGSLEELEDNLAHKKISKRAGTNSFSKHSFAEKGACTRSWDEQLRTKLDEWDLELQNVLANLWA